jgi:hypothetical protein
MTPSAALLSARAARREGPLRVRAPVDRGHAFVAVDAERDLVLTGSPLPHKAGLAQESATHGHELEPAVHCLADGGRRTHPAEQDERKIYGGAELASAGEEVALLERVAVEKATLGRVRANIGWAVGALRLA